MKSLFLAVTISGQVLFELAFAGPITSGGGFAVVCRSHDGRINTAQLLDLYEAKNKFNYELITSTGSLEGDYIASVANTYRLQGYEDSAIIDSSTRKNLDSFLERVVFLGKNQSLPNLYDLGNHLSAPQGCGIEPLAVWNDDKDIIQIKSDIWESLSTLDQAALVQHEISYHYERGYYEKTSEGARAFVATIFSTNAKPVLDEKTKNLPWAMAVSSDVSTGEQTYTTFTYALENDVLALNLFTVMNRPIVSKASARIDLTGVSLRNEFDVASKKFAVIAQTDKVRKIKSRIVTDQNAKWDIEFTFIPNKPVKIGFIQNGVLIQESILSRM